jgi:hypothetical protein
MTALGELNLLHDPFGRKATVHICRPVQQARQAMLRAIELGATSLTLIGKPGRGKTLLLDMMGREFFGTGLAIRRFELDDSPKRDAHAPFNVLLVDDAEHVDRGKLRSFLTSTDAFRPPAIVFFSCASHFIAHSVAVESSSLVELTSLTPDEARSFIIERTLEAGRLDLFEPDAIEALITLGRGSPGRLVSLGARALLLAASDPWPQILVKHVLLAMAEFELSHPTPSTTETSDEHATEGLASCASAADEVEVKKEIAPCDTIPEGCDDERLKPGPARTPNHRTRFRPVATAAQIIGLVVVSALTLNSSSGEVRLALPSRSISVIKNALTARSTEEARAGMEKTAKFLLPHSVVLIVIAPTGLEPLSVADEITPKKRAAGRTRK